MLNPTWLRTFRELVETGHFTQTANKLFMTQPGVSQHIKKLEQYCGHDLITRHSKQFELTEQGRLVYNYAKGLEAGEVQLLEKLNFDNPFSGVCTLACSGSIALRIYPELLKLQDEHPELVIRLEVAPNQRILDGIQAGNFDYGIVTDPPSDRFFQCEKLGHEEICLIVPKQTDNTGDLCTSLKSLGLISHPDALQYLTLYFSRCGLPDISSLNTNEIPISGYVNQLVQILIPVTKGLGFTALPRSTFNTFADRGSLRVVKPPRNVREPLIGVKSGHRQLPARCKTVLTHLKSIVMNF